MRTVIKANVVCLSILLLITAMAVSAWPLELTKSFTNDPVLPGDTVTLEFTIQNTDAAEVTGITFTDDLGAALSGLVATGLPMNDVCGAGSQLYYTSVLTMTGGTLPAGESCTFSVTLQVPAGATPGTYPNTTSSVSGTVGGTTVTGSSASDVLEVTSLKFSKSFDGPTVAGGMPTLSFTIENVSSTETVTNLSFTDDLDAVLSGLTAIGLPMADVCGTSSTLAGTSFLTLTGGNLPASGSCTFSVMLQMPASAPPGSYTNTTSLLSGVLGGIPMAVKPATADLQVEPPPYFSKSFTPAIIASGGTSTLTFTIDNTASALAATGLSFTDNLPAGLVVATPPNASATCNGGTLTAVAGSSIITYSGGSVPAGASCTIQVDVTSNAVGIHQNITSDLTSSSGNSGHASADLTVQQSYAVTYDGNGNTGGSVPVDATIYHNGDTATVLGNTGSLVKTGNTFAGWNTAANGSGTSYSVGDTFAMGSSNVTLYARWTEPPPIFSKNFSPDTITNGGTSTLTFTIDNTASALAATGLAFTDNLPDGLVVATPPNISTTCTGGTLTAGAGSGTITYSGGSVAAWESCTIQVDVTSSTPGTYMNTTEDLTSSQGNSGTATASLTVDDEPATIPTLNEYGMLLLFLLTIVIGFVFIYRRHA